MGRSASASDPPPPPCPYVGLAPYTEKDREYFFGRESDHRIVASNLVAARLTILYGASGVGKTSVLLAGVVPRLRRAPRTAVVVFREWQAPSFLDALKDECRAAVGRALGKPAALEPGLPLDELLLAGSRALRGRIVLLLDQFEEYFLYQPESGADLPFEVELARSVNRDEVNASVLLVTREDGLARLDRFRTRIPNLLGNRLRLRHLDLSAAEDAIRKPLDVYNERAAPPGERVRVEDGLVSAVLADVRTGQDLLGGSAGSSPAPAGDGRADVETPFLQLVLRRLWDEEANAGSRVLRLATYQRLGRAERMVRAHLETALNALPRRDRDAAAGVFRYLVTPSRTKIAYTIADLVQLTGLPTERLERVLQRLAQGGARILREVQPAATAAQAAEKRYEVFHDVLAPAVLDWQRQYSQSRERTRRVRRVAAVVVAVALATLTAYHLAYLPWRDSLPWGYAQDLTTGELHDLKDSLVRVGRPTDDIKNDVNLPQQNISRIHLMIFRDLQLIDMRSLYGTTVNAEFVKYGQSRQLQDGDILALAGETALRFSSGSRTPVPLDPGTAIVIDGKARAIMYLKPGVSFLAMNDSGRLAVEAAELEDTILAVRVFSNTTRPVGHRIAVTGRKEKNITFEVKEDDYEFGTYYLPVGEEYTTFPIRPDRVIYVSSAVFRYAGSTVPACGHRGAVSRRAGGADGFDRADVGMAEAYDGRGRRGSMAETFDERAYIARIEAAGPDELAYTLTRPTAAEERALRAHFGDGRYQRLHSLALRRSIARGAQGPRGNVVVLHGMLGSELASVGPGGVSERVWLDVHRLLGGGLGRLRLGDDGRADYDPRYEVRPTGIMKRYYGELLLSLSGRWNVRPFWYDWRKDLRLAASELDTRIQGWFDDDAPVHLVAHSMGGLVARSFIKSRPQRWARMWDAGAPGPHGRPPGRLGGRLILLGAPNHGTFAIPQVITGTEGLVRKVDLTDPYHDLHDTLQIVNSFPGAYQLLPSPLVMPAMEALYQSATYGDLRVPQRHLTNAWRHHDLLGRYVDAADAPRMVNVLGHNQLTFSGIRKDKLGLLKAPADSYDVYDVYETTLDGDGRVPHSLGRLETEQGPPVRTYYVEADHGQLATSERVLAALDGLLEGGETTLLTGEVSATRAGAAERAALVRAARQRAAQLEVRDEQRLRAFVERSAVRVASGGRPHAELPALAAAEGGPRGSGAAKGGTPSTVAAASPYVSPEERVVEESLLRNVLGAAGSRRRADEAEAAGEPAPIEIGLLYCGIQEAHEAHELLGETGQAAGRGPEPPPVDALAVGHYVGVKPQAAELALDRAISQALPGREGKRDARGEVPEESLLLTQFSLRGTLRGDLGQPFLLPDPRPAGPAPGPGGRLLAIAGMGLPGRFGAPELAVLARELCWALGAMGRRHLATVLIGAGNANLAVRDAVPAWLRGVQRALGGAEDDGRLRLQRITFVEHDPRRIREVDEALRREAQHFGARGRLRIDYQGLPDAALERAKEAARRWQLRDLETEWGDRGDGGPPRPAAQAPTRVTLGLHQRTYRFGAITASASVPEREIPLDPALVMRANDELAGESDARRQLERGRFLEGLLVPEDLRAQLYTGAPLVMALDATTARIHWEMVAQSETADRSGPGATAPEGGDPAGSGRDGSQPPEFEAGFLGTSRGFTRQLRTTFAPPPEPPPPPRRVLRVLVVADPAEDARLPGAEQEGVAVADLFAGYNTLQDSGAAGGSRVEVVRLFGPREATRTNVLRLLMLQPFDVLHYAGHCVYDAQEPGASGWIFTGGERLTANELNRIDRVPRFVFSNACESGITPDRSELRSAALAPTFAEAFFARGVTDFVCTAWPVNDVAAREFAAGLYSRLLGLEAGGGAAAPRAVVPLPMHEAMRAARLEIAGTPNGARTWGAYQHYGNPYFQLLSAPTVPAATAARIPATPGREPRPEAAGAPIPASAKRALPPL